MHQRTKIAVAVTLAVSAMSAFAQTATTETSLQRVEVTGSRIRAVDLATAQPIQVMSQEQIQKSGLVTVGDILNTLSSSGSPDFSRGAVLTSNREMGGQFLNMRNLGSERLLVLVDGKRWSQSVDGFTDMSTIPSSMIDRMEILKDGASAIYGSDAIAGVVNIILKKNMEGGQFSGYMGQNKEGDGKTKDWSLSYGVAGDKGSLMFGLSHAEQGVVWARDRALTSFTYGPNHYFDGLGTSPWGRVTPITAAGTSNTSAAAGGFNRMINHTGTYDGVGTSSDSRNPANYHAFSSAKEADLYNSTQDMMFQAPSRLTSIFTKGTLNLPMDMRFTTTAMYAERGSTTQVAGYPLTSTSQVANKVFLDKDSYYNPYGNQVAGAGLGQDVFFARRVIELPRITQNKNRTLHVDAALQGNLNLGPSTWDWSLGYNHSAVSGNTTSSGNIDLVNLKKAVGPSFLGTDGVVHCGTSMTNIVTGCVPFNVLGGPSASTPEALAYINHKGGGTYNSTVNSATADISGEIFKLPAGGLGFAAGIERREVRGSDNPDSLEQLALTTNLAGFSTVGKYTVKEAYAELNVPILKNVFLAQSLGLNLATRYSDYSNFGDTTNSKVSLTWKPINDLLVRGTWAEGFRAPALGDTFGGGSQSFDTYLDICDTAFGRASRDAAVAARCIASGAPANFRQKNQAGGNVGAAGAQTPVAFNTGVGNNSLTPETATTKTAGFVYNPSYVNGLSIAVDYFDIEVKNRVSAIGVAYTLNQCYVSGVQEFCNNFSRDATGQITQLNRGNKNMGSMSTKGIDLELNYRLARNAYGQFAIRSQTTYVDEFNLQSTNESEVLNYAGEYPYYRVKSNVNLDWSLGNWSATLGARYFSPVKTTGWDCDPAAPIECNNPTGQSAGFDGYNKLGSQVYTDLSVGYKTAWNGKIMVGINNILGRKPRSNYDAGSSAAKVDADVPLDRFFWVRYNQSF
ncbi:TonB-dependent receptor domain-containing protein [Massilia litorea]|uniref:TonB-dependent receptor n=1 Tax=Massilia litorea TaxID=2769491 RepID=A0A7L9U438_9BURK|nr:TonB-dependent receptor [Massilia litorea]QOL49831.1 TonB-dependent receptor [Massilia litorea]